MVIEIVSLAAVGAAVFEYFHNSSFKSEVTSLVQDAQTEVATLETKAAAGAAIVAADVAKVTTAVKAVAAKL